MKLDEIFEMELLKHIIRTLIESEDDLFPGLDASVFDEHKVKQQSKRTPQEEVSRIEIQVEHIVFLQNINQKEQLRLDQYLKDNDCYIYEGRANHNQDIKYSSVKGLKENLPFVYKQLKDFYFSTKSPIYNDLPTILEKYDAVLQRGDDLEAKLKVLKTKFTRVRKSAAVKEMQDQKANAPKTKIPESQIPKDFTVIYLNSNGWHKESVNNPYWINTTPGYAGHPAHFDWVKREITQYHLICSVVKKFGLPELDTAYIKRSLNKLYYYMTNSDNSFQIYKSGYSTNICTNDIRKTEYGNNLDNDLFSQIQREIKRVAVYRPSAGRKPK